MARTQILVHKWRPKGVSQTDLTRIEFRLWRRLTTVLTFTMRPSIKCCPSLSSGLAEMINKYSVLWATSVTVKHLIKKASLALLNFAKSTARSMKPSRKCARVLVVCTD